MSTQSKGTDFSDRASRERSAVNTISLYVSVSSWLVSCGTWTFCCGLVYAIQSMTASSNPYRMVVLVWAAAASMTSFFALKRGKVRSALIRDCSDPLLGSLSAVAQCLRWVGESLAIHFAGYGGTVVLLATLAPGIRGNYMSLPELTVPQQFLFCFFGSEIITSIGLLILCLIGAMTTLIVSQILSTLVQSYVDLCTDTRQAANLLGQLPHAIAHHIGKSIS
jgi:hypothetical protein